jgi:hypothetical protein
MYSKTLQLRPPSVLDQSGFNCWVFLIVDILIIAYILKKGFYRSYIYENRACVTFSTYIIIHMNEYFENRSNKETETRGLNNVILVKWNTHFWQSKHTYINHEGPKYFIGENPTGETKTVIILQFPGNGICGRALYYCYLLSVYFPCEAMCQPFIFLHIKITWLTLFSM